MIEAMSCGTFSKDLVGRPRSLNSGLDSRAGATPVETIFDGL
jgi:hypothetical protein